MRAATIVYSSVCLVSLLATAPASADRRSTAPSQPAAAIKIVVITGEDAINIIQQKTAVAPIVEVRDRNNLPVAGAAVTFTIGAGQGASFGGLSTITVTTNAAGQAAASGLTPSAAGALQINASAVFQGQTAVATITQTNVLTAAQAAGAAGAGESGNGGAGGLSGTTVAVIAGVVGGGALIATNVGGSGGDRPPATATTFSLSGQVTDSTTSTGISGATVSIADGANAGKSATTDASGNYSFTGLQQAGFTVSVSANNYVSQPKGVTLTSNQTLSFQLVRAFASVAGTWVGTYQFTQAPNGTPAQFTQSLSLSLTQSGAAVGGTWASTLSGSPVAFGTVSGTVTATSFSGSFTYNLTNQPVCQGTLAVSGSVSGNNLNWTSPLVVENCTNPPTNIIFAAVRQ